MNESLRGAEKPYDTAPDSTRSESPPPRPHLFVSGGSCFSEARAWHIPQPDAYGRVGVAAALALQGYVAEERFTSGALPAQQ